MLTVRTVRTKDRNDHEPTSLLGIIPSFERKNYQACIIDDLAFEETRKTLMSKQKQLKKQGRGNKLRAYVSWTEIFIIFVCPLEVNNSSCLVFILQGKYTLPFLVAKAYLSIIFCNIDLESLCMSFPTGEQLGFVCSQLCE